MKALCGLLVVFIGFMALAAEEKKDEKKEEKKSFGTQFAGEVEVNTTRIPYGSSYRFMVQVIDKTNKVTCYGHIGDQGSMSCVPMNYK